jgi:hypothetical protein
VNGCIHPWSPFDRFLRSDKQSSRGSPSTSSSGFPTETLWYTEEAVAGFVRDWGLKLDEVGASEWEDRETKLVVVPASPRGQTIHQVNRNSTHVTIITCAAPSGEHLISYVLTS